MVEFSRYLPKMLFRYFMSRTLQGYVLKLTSSLSTSTYDYTLPEVQFTANVSYRHFTLQFDAQVSSSVRIYSHKMRSVSYSSKVNRTFV